LELSRYLHLNPVRAKMVSDPAEYAWSSYGGYVRESRGQKWLDTSDVLNQFSRNVSDARKLYCKFVLEAIGEGHREKYYEVLDGRFLGDREFAEQTKAKAETPGYVRIKIRSEAFLKVACAGLNKKREEVTGGGKERERVRAREAICYVGRTRTELSVKSLAEVLGVDATCVSRSVSRVESRITEDKAMKNMVDEIVAVVENGKYHA